MAQTLKFGNGTWATKKGSILAYNDENENYKPLPFNYTGAGKGTRVNKEGLIEVVENDRPRIDYTDSEDGVFLLEKASTNSIIYSEDIESWSISGVITKENNVAISPDGTLNAGTITTNDAIGFNRITQTISVSSNSTYTSSLFIKKVQSQTNYMGIGFIFTGGTTDVGYVIFDAVNGIAVSADARIDVISEVKDFGDYWKLQSTATDNGSNTSLQFNIYATLSTNGTTTNLGISSPRTIWGIQLEQSSQASSYIPTQGTIQTRVAETANGSGNSEVFNSEQGVLFANISSKNSVTNKQISVNDGSNLNRVSIILNAATNGVVASTHVGGSDTDLYVLTTNNVELFNKFAYKYKANDFSFWINGFKQTATISGGSVPTANLSQLDFDKGDGDFDFYGKTKEIAYYDTVLTDLELETLTSYRSWLSMVKELNLNVIYNG